MDRNSTDFKLLSNSELLTLKTVICFKVIKIETVMGN